MRLSIDAKALLSFLEGNPDAEQLSSGEYVVDLFELDRPATMEISIKGQYGKEFDKGFISGVASVIEDVG